MGPHAIPVNSARANSNPVNFEQFNLCLRSDDQHIFLNILQMVQYRLVIDSSWRVYAKHNITRIGSDLRPPVRTVDNIRNNPHPIAVERDTIS